ncbi:MAG: hypothetical protein MZV64_26495 [Ignavibacteriales bacterium]|nr:hypothetical protein [Ignavibacteriales bacterium]
MPDDSVSISKNDESKSKKNLAGKIIAGAGIIAGLAALIKYRKNIFPEKLAPKVEEKIIKTVEGFSADELKALRRKAFNGKIPRDVNMDAFAYLNKLSGEAGEAFDSAWAG